MANASIAYKVVQFPNKMASDTWRPDVPDGWFYLGHSGTNDYNKPPFGVIVKALEPDVFKDVKAGNWDQAIRKNLIIMDHARMVWNDKGTKATGYGSVWETEGKEGIATGAMLSHDKYDQIPMDLSYSLNIAKIIKM
ncbi:hypothetical protein BDZ89DRAFT_1072731 [Hymenopellis radicata]|nr:hypothetical protein BDZ89DRAFT_1072731 [Hymenopellis radicata]